MDIVMGIGIVVAALFGIMISVYLSLCLMCWIIDIIDHKKWRYWK